MGTINCPEIRVIEEEVSPEDRAKARDAYVRNFERIFNDWSDIARVCLDVERDKDYERLGFSSWHQWLLAAAPKSRSYIYLVTRRLEKLEKDFTMEELAEIPLGSAGILVTMPESKRRDPVVRKAATKPPADFIEELQKAEPDQHIEARVKIEVDFSTSQWQVVNACFEKYKEREGETSLAEFIEWCCSEVSEWTLHADTAQKGKDDSNGPRVQ